MQFVNSCATGLMHSFDAQLDGVLFAEGVALLSFAKCRHSEVTKCNVLDDLPIALAGMCGTQALQERTLDLNRGGCCMRHDPQCTLCQLGADETLEAGSCSDPAVLYDPPLHRPGPQPC